MNTQEKATALLGKYGREGAIELADEMLSCFDCLVKPEYAVFDTRHRPS